MLSFDEVLSIDYRCHDYFFKGFVFRLTLFMEILKLQFYFHLSHSIFIRMMIRSFF